MGLLPLLLPQLLLLLLLLLLAPSALLLDAALSVRTLMGTQHQNQNLNKERWRTKFAETGFCKIKAPSPSVQS